MTKSYGDGPALRRASEKRLTDRQAVTGLPMDRLRKEVALQRLLARIAATAPEGSWALKGGMAMIARVGNHARATVDADATWRVAHQELEDMLDIATELDLSDFFEFEVGRPSRLQSEHDAGGLRFAVQSRLGGRLFEPLRLDINLAPGDPRPIEVVPMRNGLDFAGLPEVLLPVIRAEQQLAEKLHAYTRDYGTQENSRAKDLYDMLIIAEQLPLPSAVELVGACRQTFAIRATTWPPVLAAPPSGWTVA